MALGINILVGVKGQVSLGHAFFMGVGVAGQVSVETATSGRPACRSTKNSVCLTKKATWGHSLPIWVWLPGAGIAAALIGIFVSPVAVKAPVSTLRS